MIRIKLFILLRYLLPGREWADRERRAGRISERFGRTDKRGMT